MIEILSYIYYNLMVVSYITIIMQLANYKGSFIHDSYYVYSYVDMYIV